MKHITVAEALEMAAEKCDRVAAIAKKELDACGVGEARGRIATEYSTAQSLAARIRSLIPQYAGEQEGWDGKYFIVCAAHGGYLLWRPRRSGYTLDIDDAGRYECADAAEIQDFGTRYPDRGDFAVPTNVIEKLARRQVSCDDLAGATVRSAALPSPPLKEQK